ncbi:glycosyltransferase [Actinomadura sp. ATCC 31491]|uniref:Glycosyltransferase n=1 Tax=Actinomadura luzonensis TaxID=2805427 RepID=A0ABT0FR48_9ACTN|nr:glycosyltransferase [Actinomadura luzonensis]MCK2214808.1 glycosyltransferase [Actinomadura luzonensis]
MRVLLSTIGSRGDVQPLVALATELRELGHEARLCVPPDFRAWIEGLGFPVVAIGPELRSTATAAPRVREHRRSLAEETVAAQFATLVPAAGGCDVIVAATALQLAARSVAESLRIPYVFTAYCPAVLPSPHHAPPLVPGRPPASGNRELWERDAESFNELFGAALDAGRAALGLPPAGDVRGHVLTGLPWLAADPALAPWPSPGDDAVFQTGAWLLPDERPLPAELEAFLDAGEPPVYYGFGSMRVPDGLAEAVAGSARELGVRAVVARGWGQLAPPGLLSVDEVNHQALFRRVAAVVHHGGAGTTTAAARAGAPQVVLPQLYDQHYWAGRVQELGIGAAHPPGVPSAGSLTAALDCALKPDVAARAQALAGKMRDDGARTAARHLLAL